MQLNTDEAERLAALANYGVLDADFGEAYDCITRLSAKMFGTPVSLVNIIDRHRQWAKSAYGMDVSEIAREDGFCKHVIQQTEVYVVPNAEESERHRDNPFVAGDAHLRFYAGAPLITTTGYALGTLCVIDTKPRDMLTDEEKSMLQDFAQLIVLLLEQRKELCMLRRRCAEAADD